MLLGMDTTPGTDADPDRPDAATSSAGSAEPPTWLDDDEQRAWRALAAVVLKLPGALDAQLRRDHGLRHVDYWVLALLSEADGRRSPLHRLAGQANASLSRLSHVVTRLEQRGLVTREASTQDARVTDAVLTDAGFEVLERAAPDHVAEVRRLVFDALDPDEVATLEHVAASIAAQLDDQRR